jgi:hypothetical protein
MGHLTICNPLAQLYAQLPYIALHNLEHDSFSFAGDVHGQGRADVKLLWDVLHSKGPAHRADLANDMDADGVSDPEERHFGTDPQAADSNQDGLPDGFALARKLWRGIESLPRLDSSAVPPANGASYAVDHLLRGVIPCPVCGIMVNMGWIEIINPGKACSLEISYLKLHYLEQGGFGDATIGRVDPMLLGSILQPAILVTSTDGQVTLRWMSQTGHTYQISSATNVAGPWSPREVLKGDGNELTFTESQPAGSAQMFYKVTASL